MPLIYDSINKNFIKQEQQKHSGNKACYQDSPVESFTINQFANPSQYDASFFEFDTPSYYTLGGTINYYGQDYWSIFTNIYRPFIKFTFTGNTDHFGTGTTILHNVYRITRKDFLEYASEVIRKDISQNKDFTTETVEESVTDESGNTKTITTTKKIASTSTSEKTAPKDFPELITGFSLDTLNGIEKMKSLLSNPILTVTAATSSITSYTYILFLSEYEKSAGNFQQQMFQDYAQYFVTTQFEFSMERGAELCEFYQIDSEKKLTSYDYQKSYKQLTPAYEHTITGGTFSGVTTSGNFFTYFLIPNKPILEAPVVRGALKTFSPKFFWSNTNDGDSFVLQVVYNSGDSQSFSGTVYSYPITKENSVLSTSSMLNVPDGDWSIAQKKTDTVREYSVPLSYGSDFWYRIGNVKELINIFGVKQTVITFSNIESATTYSESYQNQVFVQSDSPHTETSTTLQYPEYLEDTIDLLTKYSLSGTIYGSVLTGATAILTYPNNNYITQPADSVGNYFFENLERGVYKVAGSYRGYRQSTPIDVVVTANTVAPPITIYLTWDNNWDLWGDIGDHLMG